MQNTKKSDCDGDVAKPKGRRIVSWSQEEDEILRNQIRIHGTENWSIVASKFKDKTTRQCRRRWYTYLNSDFKKGGWSAEEDMLLCEAQKAFGNRWTEIAKVVSGRTDNAVKNRFTTLCKKRAKSEAMVKENNTSHINENNKRVINQDKSGSIAILETSPLKKTRRNQFSDVNDNSNKIEISFKDYEAARNKHLRFPLSVLQQNSNTPIIITSQHNAHTSEMLKDEANKVQGTFLKKDDPRIFALLQQAELLSSLAIKVNTENTDQSLENAWKVLQDFLNQAKGTDMLDIRISDLDFQIEDFRDLIEDLQSTNNGSQTCWRPYEIDEYSAGSSEYSTGSTFVLSETTGDKLEQNDEGEKHELYQDSMAESQPNHICNKTNIGDCENGIFPVSSTIQDMLQPRDNSMKGQDRGISTFSSTEFGSPLRVMPVFRSPTSVPSPKFSESERQFLLKALGMDSPSCNPSNNYCQPPPCKRSLLQSL